MELHADAASRPVASQARHPLRPSAGGHGRHSRFVGLLRVVLPALALVLLAVVAVWPYLARQDEGFRVGFAQLAPSAVETLSMQNARYHGLDKSNRPFTLTSDRGVEEDQEHGVVVLDNPKADFVTNSGASVYVEAKLGTFYQQEQLLVLEGEVSLYHDQGYEMHTERARVNLRDSTAEGNDPVTGQGPQGRINGTGFRLLDQGRRIMVTGQSQAVLSGVHGKGQAKSKAGAAKASPKAGNKEAGRK